MKDVQPIYRTFDELPVMLSIQTVAHVLGISRPNTYELAHSKGFSGRWEGRYTAGCDPETGRLIYKKRSGKTKTECRSEVRRGYQILFLDSWAFHSIWRSLCC